MMNGKQEKDGSLNGSKKKIVRNGYKLSMKIKLVEEYKSHRPTLPMTKWLEKHNVTSENGSQLAYSSFKKWVRDYDSMIRQASSANEGKGRMEQKKLRSRPFKDMENILAEYLRLRNIRLRSEGKPISSSNFIRKKAEEFYIDLYGEEKARLFKASAGWAYRFQQFFKNILEPSSQKKYPQEQTRTESADVTREENQQEAHTDVQKSGENGESER